MNRWIITFAAASLAVGTAYAGDDRGQGKGQGQGQGQGQQNTARWSPSATTGRTTAISRARTGKDYTEWCESRGGRYATTMVATTGTGECYQKAYKKG